MSCKKQSGEVILSILVWLSIAGLIILLDWWTKSLAQQHLELYRPQPVTGWLNWALAYNYGAAFSFLSDAGGWQRWLFSGLAVVVSVVVLVWLIRLRGEQRTLSLALALILGGAIGNVIDRLHLGYVIDFIDVHYAGWHWPAFNVADSALTVGAVLFAIDAIFLEPKRRRQSD